MKKIITLCVFMACPLQGMQRMKQLFARACAAGKVAFTKGDAAPQAETLKRVATRAALYSSALTTSVTAGYCAASIKKSLGAPNTSPLEKNMDMYISLSKTLQTLSADAPELLETAQEVISDAIQVSLDKGCTEIKNIIKKSPEHARIIASVALEKIDNFNTPAIIAAAHPVAFNVLKDVVCANIHKISDIGALNSIADLSPEHARIIASAALEKISDVNTLVFVASGHPVAFNVLKDVVCANIHKTYAINALKGIAAQSSEHARIIASAALEKIDDLDTLARIAAAHPAAFNVLKDFVCANIDKIYDRAALQDLAEQSPEHARIIASAALEKISDINILASMASDHPVAFNVLKDVVCANIHKISDIGDLNSIAGLSPEHARIIASAVLEKISDVDILASVASAHHVAFNVLKDVVCANIHKISDIVALRSIAVQSSEHAHIIASAALEKISDVDTLTSVASGHPVAFNVLKDVVCANIHKISDIGALKGIAAQSSEHAHIIASAALEKISDINILASVASAHHVAFNVLKEKLFMSQPKTASTGYLGAEEHAQQLVPCAARYRQPYFKQVLEQEKALSEQGYTCLYHGQRSIYGFQEDFTRDLLHELHQQGYVTEPLRPDFLYIQHRNKITVHDGDEEEAASIIKTARKEQQDMMQGRKPSNERTRLPHRLSANLFLWGNLFNDGSCTVYYLTQNKNAHDVLPPLETDVFENLQIPSSISMRYHTELTELQQLHARLFTKGRLLQIAVPTKKLDEYVYLACPGAYKTNAITKRGEEISSPQDFLCKATTSPEEFEAYELDRRSEVAIPLTAAYALNPHSDIKIYAYDPEPQDAACYQEYKERRKALARAIAQDVAQHASIKGKNFELCCKPLQAQFKEAIKALSQWD